MMISDSRRTCAGAGVRFPHNLLMVSDMPALWFALMTLRSRADASTP